MEPQEALRRAIAHHRAGRLAEAAVLYEQALAEDPGNADALQLLGLVKHRLGRSTEALGLLDRAVAADPEHTPAWVNRALVQRALGKAAEAESSLRRALAVRSDLPEALFELGRLRFLARDLDQALDLARRATEARPGWGEAWRLVGAALLEAGRPVDAEAAFRQALAARADDAGALADLGESLRLQRRLGEAETALKMALAANAGLDPAALALARLMRERGRPDEAAKVYEAALRRSPGLAEAWLGLGNARREAGDEVAAQAAWKQATLLRPGWVEAEHNLGASLCRAGRAEEGLLRLARAATASTEAWPWIGFADAVAAHLHGAPAEPVQEAIAACFAVEGVDHQALERAVRSWIEADIPGLTEAVARIPEDDGEPEALDPDVGAALLAHPMLPVLLAKTVVRHPGWEDALRGARRQLLREAAGGIAVPHLRLVEAFARQGFHTEYAWWGSHEARAIRAIVEAGIADRVDREPLSDELAVTVAAIAMYSPLHAVEGVAAMVAAGGWREGPLGELLELQVMGPLEEAHLAERVPSLGLTEDAVSVAVRRQYEENPYPRLVSWHRKPAEPLDRVVRSLLPHVRDLPSLERPRILVAGCGTGQQALAAATRYEGAQVLAVDLSRRSAAATWRRARAWKLGNLDVAQADILALGSIGRTFDLVECGGVLHHMADPMAGWRVLTGLLAPGGLMKIGLYSERSRQPVVAARELVAERGFSTDRVGLRRARRAFLALDEGHPARSIVWSPDFYSLSGFRDLVFHVQEHRFTLPRLAESLRALDLEMLGFQFARPEAAAWYAELWPGDVERVDLGRWEAVEEAHPEVFAGMYQFWVRKRDQELAGRTSRRGRTEPGESRTARPRSTPARPPR